MANPEITNNDTTEIPVFNPKYKDVTLVFDGADTWAKGMLLGLRKVAAGAVTPDAGNTGDGTLTALALAPGGPPIAGDWNVECIAAVANGGTFKIEDPAGNIVANDLVMTASAGAATTFVVGGMTFIITDGAADFIVGDKFAVVMTAVNKYTIYDAGSLDGAEIPSAIMPVAQTETGAGDVLKRIIVGGEVTESELSIDDGSPITETVRNQLRDFTILSVASRSIDGLDNQ
jgi:hypothetical protein